MDKGEKQVVVVNKPIMGRSRKGCMKGKGGDEAMASSVFVGDAASMFGGGFNNNVCDGLWGSPVMNWPETCFENDFVEMNDVGVFLGSENFMDRDGLQPSWSF
ncbi:hypothetical protein FEM48_Zijuj02G0174700 [Ziziphus jujuba var. spinosa]|uniref:Uncharacterized protein n=1 Tax=Ziziphus jujuba var. spinosa TaxID=714518 RepID=A0A978VX03_ZIZJJ|nr:hypothetical protein FEM48_Zijuj02G0174700 [Ziziphus jujuba var. spinosa]